MRSQFILLFGRTRSSSNNTSNDDGKQQQQRKMFTQHTASHGSGGRTRFRRSRAKLFLFYNVFRSSVSRRLCRTLTHTHTRLRASPKLSIFEFYLLFFLFHSVFALQSGVRVENNNFQLNSLTICSHVNSDHSQVSLFSSSCSSVFWCTCNSWRSLLR